MAPPSWLPDGIAVGTIATVWAYIRQVQNTRLTRAVDLNLRLEADFFGPDKRRQRVKAARRLLDGQALEAEPILDFFETMALLHRRGVLDREIVHHTFFYWVDRYYEATRQHVAERQKIDPLIWKDFVAFVEKLRKFHSAQPGALPYTPPDPLEIARFLQEELTEST